MRAETKAGLGFIGAFSIAMIGIILSIGVTPVRATELPPLKYRGEPTVPYSVSYVSRAEVGRRCAAVLNFAEIKQAAKGKRAPLTLNGCVAPGNHVYIANDMSPSQTRRVLAHELGHVKGWKHK
jgi:hypothetical protein